MPETIFDLRGPYGPLTGRETAKSLLYVCPLGRDAFVHFCHGLSEPGRSRSQFGQFLPADTDLDLLDPLHREPGPVVKHELQAFADGLSVREFIHDVSGPRVADYFLGREKLVDLVANSLRREPLADHHAQIFFRRDL